MLCEKHCLESTTDNSGENIWLCYVFYELLETDYYSNKANQVNKDYILAVLPMSSTNVIVKPIAKPIVTYIIVIQMKMNENE